MGDDGPPFSPRQLGDMLLEYYRFLTTLHFNRAELRVPPEAGWPQLTDEYCADFKAPFALETLRHLPFWQSADNDLEYLQIAEYNSRFINYLALSSAEFAEFDTKLYPYYEGDREAGADFQQDPDRSHCILLAKGSETGGVNLILDTYRGVILKDMVAMDVNSHDIKEYLDGLQDKFRTLEFIPSSVGRVTLDGDDVTEATERITEQQLVDQRFQEGEDEPDWGTDLEMRFVRQVYREHGWPRAFQKEAAFAAVDRVIQRVQIECGSGAWPTVFWD
ncbi:hypothetical protein K4F52_008990 [Lecanicillium sp. MT-2017a]|nr:hypothetical protein K4F52_008990 [Lecanicillium sp. MT-2017a]